MIAMNLKGVRNIIWHPKIAKLLKVHHTYKFLGDHEFIRGYAVYLPPETLHLYGKQKPWWQKLLGN
jgi:hypothetical protein